jgi:hypothetical protein
MSSREELTNVQLSKMLAENQRALDEQVRVTAAASQEIARLKRINDKQAEQENELRAEVEKLRSALIETTAKNVELQLKVRPSFLRRMTGR